MAVSESRPVVRIQADSFLNPRAVRYRRGRFSAEGYLHDTYDFAALRSNVLAPLRVGDRRSSGPCSIARATPRSGKSENESQTTRS